MKKLPALLCILLFVLIFKTASAQKEYIEVIYSITYHRGIADTKPTARKAVLIIKPNSGSNYALKNLIISDSIYNAHLANPPKEIKLTGAYYDEFRELIKKDYSSKKLDVTCKGSGIADNNYYNYKQDINLNWTPSEGLDSLLGYACQKATVSYMGRDYVAWYAPELPISDGPWKFHGLPGLILRVYDTQNIFDFKVFSIKEVNSDITQDLFKNAKKIIPITHEAYWKENKYRTENPKDVIIAKYGDGTFNGVKISDPNSKKARIFNRLETDFIKE
ncbi:GLPGLI family protein [Lacihabitans lacunae]|uniref:GLPGLI family protein n=1 Tax=Lacihabitans lacunae TaxID=1028214 RepID=A0ABV7YZS2_9BACT